MTRGFLSLLIIIAGLVCLPGKSLGQEEECLTRLDNATTLFNSGIFEDIPFLLSDCLESFKADDRQEAYRLLVLASYMNDDVGAAEQAMLDLIKAYPEFKPSIDDQADFHFVYESFRVRKVMDLGFFTGPVFTPVSMIEPYGPFQAKFQYSASVPGFLAGALFSFPINSLISINTSPSVSRYSFDLNYAEPINGIIKLEQTERNIMMYIPVQTQFTFLENQFQPYVKAGGALGILISAETESKIDRLDPSTKEIINASESIRRDHSGNREKLYYYLGGGVGLRINFNKFYLFAEADYYHPLNIVLLKGKNRYEQSNLWSEGWVDSDFRILNTSFTIGIVRSLYSIKKTR